MQSNWEDSPEDRQSLHEFCPNWMTNRRQLLQWVAGLGIGTTVFHRALADSLARGDEISVEMVKAAQWVADLDLTEEQQKELAKTLQNQSQQQLLLRKIPLDDNTPPAMVFMPHFFAQPTPANPQPPQANYQAKWTPAPIDHLSIDHPDLPFASLSQLASGLRQKRWTSLQLTELYLKRLKKYDPLLRCVISLTEETALAQAKQADLELQNGQDRGPLHGIPWGAKDLIAVPGYKTTWGAKPYRDRSIHQEATVAQRLREAGAVLVAKLSLGTLAWGEIWHDAATRNPWNPAQGSSGSSAGSACATVAGLVGFSLGSETLGSIVSPTRRCRITGLRPTFGRISRYGCMTLAWSMDKIGPIVRSVEDAALVFAAIAGSDGRDPSVVDRPFQWPVSLNLPSLRIGVVGNRRSPLEQKVLDHLTSLGAQVVPLQFANSIPESTLLSALGCEAATMHEDLFRSGASDDDLGKWGPTFRQSHWTPAVHYLRGLRARTLLIRETEEALQQVDVLLGSEDLVRTNLSGHPSLVVALDSEERRIRSNTEPSSDSDANDNSATASDSAKNNAPSKQSPPAEPKRQPGVIKLTARLFGEETLLFLGDLLQRAFPPQPSQPPLDDFLADLKSFETFVDEP